MMLTPRVRGGLLLLAALFGAACVDSGLPTTSDSVGAIGGGGNSTSLVGRWSRTVIFAGDDGNIHQSETIWEFRHDSTAERSVIASSVGAGAIDTVVATARWVANGLQVTISFIEPDSGEVTFDYSVRADTLTLGGEDFIRDD